MKPSYMKKRTKVKENSEKKNKWKLTRKLNENMRLRSNECL